MLCFVRKQIKCRQYADAAATHCKAPDGPFRQPTHVVPRTKFIKPDDTKDKKIPKKQAATPQKHAAVILYHGQHYRIRFWNISTWKAYTSSQSRTVLPDTDDLTRRHTTVSDGKESAGFCFANGVSRYVSAYSSYAHAGEDANISVSGTKYPYSLVSSYKERSIK